MIRNEFEFLKEAFGPKKLMLAAAALVCAYPIGFLIGTLF